MLARASCALIAGMMLCQPLARADGGASPEQKKFNKLLESAIGSKKKSDGVAGGRLGTRRMRRANRVAARVLEERMRRYRRGDLMLIRRAGAAEVIVVRGGYDRVQDVLRAIKVKHVVVPPRLVSRLPLMSTQTLMVNCPGRLSAAAVRRVRRFVKTGGYLITTDWALTLVQRAFPGYIKRAGRNTRNDVVKVKLHKHDESMLKHVRAMKTNPRWWLEASSYPIRVLNRQKVKVLISSAQMRKRYGYAPIAVLFRYDDGKVLHMTSHFYLQQARLRNKRERAKGSAFAQSAGLRGKALKRLKRAGIDKVKAGELNSAYSMQQVTANVLVNRAKSRRTLLRKYRRRARRKIRLEKSAKSRAPKSAPVGKSFRVRVLERKGKRVKVRDLFGNEGWTDQANLL